MEFVQGVKNYLNNEDLVTHHFLFVFICSMLFGLGYCFITPFL